MPQLEDILQYHFKNPHLLTQALTHSSITNNEHRNYERFGIFGRPRAGDDNGSSAV